MGEYVDANGRKRYVSAKSKPEVRQKRRKLLEDRDAGIAQDSEGLTVEWYMDRWLESIRDQVRPGTYKPYEAIVVLISGQSGGSGGATANLSVGKPLEVRWRVEAPTNSLAKWLTDEGLELLFW